MIMSKQLFKACKTWNIDMLNEILKDNPDIDVNINDKNLMTPLDYVIMNEEITWKVLVSLIIIILGIFMVKKGNKGIKNN